LIDFSASLAPGAHTISIFAGGTAFDYSVSVGSQAGVRDLIAYPNPFQDETYFVYSNDLEIEGGAIDIFTASGKKVAHLDLPTSARAVGQNAVRWDGTTWNGGQVANGVYLYVVSIDQRGQTTTQRGKLVRVR
jgi:flagellar hook assembly protein FlgD